MNIHTHTHTHTQKFIHENSLDLLISKFSLIANYSKRYPNLVQLCYNQLDTPKNEITNECRGIILDTSDNYKIVSYPFYRFSDLPLEKNIDYNKLLDLDSIKFYEKLDGSIISLYYYNNEWNVSTKTMPDADGKIYNINKTFRDYFFEVFNNLNYKLPNTEPDSNPENINRTYVFEFMFNNQGITQKSKESISLIMVRDNITLQELNHINIANENNWDKVNPIDVKSINDAIKIVKELDPVISEGFVVCDKNYNRFKIKSPQFDNIQELKVNWDNTHDRQIRIEKDNFRKICNIIRTNKHKSFLKLEKYNSLTNQYNIINNTYDKLILDTNNFLSQIDFLNINNKELGLLLKNKEHYLNTLAFGLKNLNLNKNTNTNTNIKTYIEDYFYNMNIKTFEEIIKKML